MNSELTIRTEYGAPKGRCIDLDAFLDPNEEMELAHSVFQEKYGHVDIEKMPEEAYDDYRDIEDIFARCNPPKSQSNATIDSLRRIMQKYAQSEKDKPDLFI